MSGPAFPFESLPLSDIQLLRLPDAAAIAGLSVRTIRRALRASTKRLKCYRFGRSVRIAPDDLAEWIRGHADLEVVSSTVMDTLSAEARELIQNLSQPTDGANRPGDRTAKGRPRVPADNLATKPLTRLDCAAESSVHVTTELRSKEEPTPMYDASKEARRRARPARRSRSAR